MFGITNVKKYLTDTSAYTDGVEAIGSRFEDKIIENGIAEKDAKELRKLLIASFQKDADNRLANKTFVKLFHNRLGMPAIFYCRKAEKIAGNYPSKGFISELWSESIHNLIELTYDLLKEKN